MKVPGSLRRASSLCLLSLAIAAGAQAGSSSGGSLTLVGIVPVVFSVRITSGSSTGSSSALGSPGANARGGASSFEDIEVAKIVEFNNSAAAYEVTVSSKNRGAIRSPAGERSFYELQYNGERLDVGGRDAAVAWRGFREAGTTTTHSLRVRPESVSKAASGEYHDVLTFSVAAI